MHYAFATVNDKGEPHVTPIGGLVLRDDCTGCYFEEYPVHLPANIEKNNRVCVLAVNAKLQFWGKALAEGKFDSPPQVLYFTECMNTETITDLANIMNLNIEDLKSEMCGISLDAIDANYA
jgi:hypothetical protein